LTLFCGSLLAGASFAAPVTTQGKDAGRFIDTMGHRILDVLNTQSMTDAAKEETLVDMFRTHVDTPWIGKFVLGQYWRTASEAQKTRYMQTYPEFLARTYASRFVEYTGETFEMGQTKPLRAGEYQVETRILRKGQQPLVVLYLLRMTPKGGFKVYDVVVEGISQLTTQRSEFTSVAARQGVDYLIERMETKVAKLVKAAGAQGR
jgi:phospholipid transport system substrate-binding protein